MRTGNKKPAMTVKKSVATGPDKNKAHVANASKVVNGGKGVHGMPLMSAAAAKVKH